MGSESIDFHGLLYLIDGVLKSIDSDPIDIGMSGLRKSDKMAAILKLTHL